MKKLLLIIAVAALSILTQLSCGGSDDNKCADISGNYNVTKTFESVSATQGGGSVTIQNGLTVLPSDTSTLDITQIGCAVAVVETIQNPSISIPYAGSTDKDDNYTFSISTPSSLNLPLNVTIAGTSFPCQFSGQVTWDGKQKDSDLKGTIDYKLKIITGTGCPDTLTLKYNSTAAKK